MAGTSQDEPGHDEQQRLCMFMLCSFLCYAPAMPPRRRSVFDDPPAAMDAAWRRRALRYGRQSGRGHGRWKAFDETVADAMLLRVMRGEPWRRMLETDPAMPCRVVVYRWRREHPDWDGALKLAFKVGRLARERVRRAPSPELVDRIADRIALGGSLRSVGGQADMPCARTLYSWFARFPEFAAAVEQACDVRVWWHEDQMLDVAARDDAQDLAAIRRAVAPLQQQLNRLAKRPGWKRRRAARNR